MFQFKNLRAHVFLTTFAVVTLLPGVWSLATTPVTGLGSDVLGGSTQRLYETRFEDSFPYRDTLRQSWTALKYAAFGEISEGAIAGFGGVLFTSEEFTTPNTHRDFAAALAGAHERISDAGGELIPIILPDKARMMSEVLPRKRSAHFDKRYAHLLQIIEAEGLRTIDLRHPLTGSGSFMVTDTHWSPAGARAVAGSLAPLLSNDLNTTSAFETVKIGRREFDGDLLAFAQTGPWRQWVGPAPEQITMFETTSVASVGLGLFDEVASPIALVGTSFSAREDFHFVGFLKSALQADVVSFAMEGHGPFVPMNRFLEGDSLREAAPQFVIWEIPERYLDTWSYDQ